MLYEIRLKIADFLNTVLLDNQIIFLNLWHIVHFISGAIVMFFIFKFFKKYKIESRLIILLIILVLYELFEWLFIIKGSSLFRPEIELDTFWDIALGFLGGILVLRFKKLLFH